MLRKSVDSKTGPKAGPKLPAVISALRHRNFRLFFFGYLISLTGIWMQWVAQSWLIYRLTESAFLLGLLSFSGNIPIFLLAPFGGAIADRFPRRHILFVTQSLAMVLSMMLALLTLNGGIQVWQVFTFVVMIGITNALDIPTHQAFIADVAGKEDLLNAIALNSSIINCTRIMGPAIAGLLVASVGEGWCFLINSISFVPVIISLLLMRDLAVRESKPPLSTFGDVIEGLAFVRRQPVVRSVLLLLALLSLIGMSYTVLLPILADQVLDSGPNGLGLLIGATGVGALLAALSFASYSKVRGLTRWIVISSISFSLGLISLSLSRAFWLSIALLLTMGFSQVVQLDSSNKLLQTIVPDHLRGRMMSLYILVMMGMVPFGALLAGWLARRLGAPLTMSIGGLVYLVCVILVAIRLPGGDAQSAELARAYQPEREPNQ